MAVDSCRAVVRKHAGGTTLSLQSLICDTGCICEQTFFWLLRGYRCIALEPVQWVDLLGPLIWLLRGYRIIPFEPVHWVELLGPLIHVNAQRVFDCVADHREDVLREFPYLV